MGSIPMSPLQFVCGVAGGREGGAAELVWVRTGILKNAVSWNIT